MNQAALQARGGVITLDYYYKKLRRAVKMLDISVFREDGLEDDNVYVGSRGKFGNNILHKAIQYHNNLFRDDPIAKRYERFITEVIKRFPKLMWQKDDNGDTPLHIAARLLSSDAAKILLRVSFKCWYDWRGIDESTSDDESTQYGGSTQDDVSTQYGGSTQYSGSTQDDEPTQEDDESTHLDMTLPPWKVKDSKGNTPIHVAACTEIGLLDQITDALKSRDLNEALSEVNNYGEAALHLLTRHMKFPDHHNSIDDKFKELSNSMLNLMNKWQKSLYLRDMDGMTPHLRAAKCGRCLLALLLARISAKLSRIRDYNGRNVLHHLCSSMKQFCIGPVELVMRPDDPGVDEEIMLTKDEDGNTPLHLAIIHQHFEIALALINQFNGKENSSSFIMELKETRNREGKTIMHYLTSMTKLGSNTTANKLKEVLELAGRSSIMDDMLYQAATNGDLNTIKSKDVEDYSLNVKTQDGSTILHIALRNHHSHVLDYALKNDHFDLIYWKDSKGDTPLHLAALLQTQTTFTFLESCIQTFKTYDKYYAAPWKEKNSKGNTYLHEAARLRDYKVIFSESLKDQDVSDVNHRGETVLHVIVSYATSEAKKYLENLSEQMKSLIHIQDVDGFTPVLRAVQYGRLGVAVLLIKECPHSVWIPDNKGRTVLHHLKGSVVDLAYEVRDLLPVWNSFYKIPGVDELRIAQDIEGNTPLHLAIIDGNFTKMKFLMENCFKSKDKRELDIVNKEGHSIFDLASSQVHRPAKEELQSSKMNRSYIKEGEYIDTFMSRRNVKEREYMENVMDDDLYQKTIDGDISIFKRTGADVENLPPTVPEYFCKQTPGGSNIIHIALRHRNEKMVSFIEKAVEAYPILSMGPDSNGDTSLHLAAKWKSAVPTVKSLIKASQGFLETLDDTGKALHVEPWAMKNQKGSYPIHEALQTGNLDAAFALLECDDKAAVRVNDLGDTPLHSFAQNGFSIRDYKKSKEFVEMLLTKNNRATYVRNDEGHTPLLTAASSGCLLVVRAILECRPQSACLRDAGGRTFLHLMRFTGEGVDESLDGTFKELGKQLFDIPEANAQRLVQDYDGNTPLHHSIIMENSIVSIVLTQKCMEDEEQELKLVNKKGQTIPDLLAKHDVPNEVIKLIMEKDSKVVNLARSSYGIRKTEMKESANALSVVAALLATITFAAAFQVPGGFSDDGFPNLLGNLAYAIFALANTIAMCSSMLCLFLLLWVMGIGKIHGSLKVLDISIVLLRISFYFTLLTFTSGVFVATPKQSLWLGISVCVLGFFTFLLTFKYSVKTVARYGGYAKSLIKKAWPPNSSLQKIHMHLLQKSPV